MKKLIVSAFVIAGFAAAVFAVPNVKVKVEWAKAEACDNPGCNGG